MFAWRRRYGKQAASGADETASAVLPPRPEMLPLSVVVNFFFFFISEVFSMGGGVRSVRGERIASLPFRRVAVAGGLVGTSRRSKLAVVAKPRPSLLFRVSDLSTPGYSAVAGVASSAEEPHRCREVLPVVCSR